MIKIKNNSGFTLIEVVAVIGVLAITSAVLIANNRLNELQISLNTNIANIANTISRAKSLTLQGAGADKNICGYGVDFAQGLNNAPDTYTIYSYTDCVEWRGGEALSGQGGINNLSSGLRFSNPPSLNTDSQFIKDVVFYSSDAKTKLFNFSDKSICLETGCDVKSRAGIIVINTESFPTSFATLKISTTGQVTSKAGVYSTVENFDNGVQSETTTEDGEVVITEGTQEPGGGGQSGEEVIVDSGGGFGNEDCIANCACATNLASGQTCSDGCGGVCYAGNDGGDDDGGGGGQPCVPTPGICDGKTCADRDNCNAPCLVCDSGFGCTDKQCKLCTSCEGKKCGDSNDCGGVCTFCEAGECKQSLDSSTWLCVVSGPTLRVDSIFPPIGTK